MSLESQLAALIEAIAADIKNKVNTTDSRLSNSREWNAATVPRAEAEAGTAATRRAWTAARVRQSMRAGILGEVSQESGVPTGAIIERGSNANGEYVRFADGTQICFAAATSSASSGITVTLPAAFVNNLYRLGMTPFSSAMTFGLENVANDSFSFGCWDTSGARAAVGVRWLAIGRWY